MITKANDILKILRRSMYGCKKATKMRACTALWFGHFLEYCAPVWSPQSTKDIDEIEQYLMQKRAAQWITARWDKVGQTLPRSHLKLKTYLSLCEASNITPTPFRSHLKWNSLQQMRTYLSLREASNIIHHSNTIPFSRYWQFSHTSTRKHPLALNCLQPRITVLCYSEILCLYAE